MDPVIVMISKFDEGVYDVEVMPDIPVGILTDTITQAFGWHGLYEIEVEGRRLLPHQTLAEVSAWDGVHLTFVPSSSPSSDKKSQNHTLEPVISHPDKPKGKRKLKQPDDNESSSVSRSGTKSSSQKDQRDAQVDTPLKAWKPISQDEKEEAPSSSPSTPLVRWKFTASSEKKSDDGPEKQ